MGGFEDLTAELISSYRHGGDWDSVVTQARVLAEGLRPLAGEPRMEICLYHVEAIPLRIAYRRRDIGLVRVVARQSQHLEVSGQAFRALQQLEIRCDERVFHEAERDLGTVSNTEGQISRMRNPDPRLIGTRFFPRLYVAEKLGDDGP
jgi:hypothetical protein